MGRWINMKSLNLLVQNSAHLLCFAFVALSTGCTQAAPKCGDAKACAAEAMVAGNLDSAYRLLLPLAEAGDAESQVSIALILVNGGGMAEAKHGSKERRDMLALPWIRRAAIGANRQAIYWLADGYKYGWFEFSVDKVKEACLRKAGGEKRSAASCLN